MEDFVVAYTYNARSRSWERRQIGEGDEEDGYTGVVRNGQGVWVYSRSNVVLVP